MVKVVPLLNFSEFLVEWKATWVCNAYRERKKMSTAVLRSSQVFL